MVINNRVVAAAMGSTVPGCLQLVDPDHRSLIAAEIARS